MKASSHAEIDRRCAGFEAVCRRRGIRITAQRLAVYRALASDSTHPTAEILYHRLAGRVPGLSQATVYRTLEFLAAENLIRRVSGPEAVGRFDAKLDRHQHLICRVCGSLTDVSLAQFREPELPEIPGFAVEEMDIRIVGRCRRCAATGSVNAVGPRRRGRVSSTAKLD